MKNFFTPQGFIFNILKIGFLFLPVTPSVLGITFIKEEFSNKHNLKKAFLILGNCLIIVTLGGFWYPFPFAKNTFDTFNNKTFANELMASYYKEKIVIEDYSEQPAEETNTETPTPPLATNGKTQGANAPTPTTPTTPTTDGQSQQGTNNKPTSTSNNNNSGAPNIIYKDRFMQEKASTQEINYVQQNWNQIKNNDNHYEFDGRKRKLFYDIRNKCWFRKTQSFWWGNWTF
ncbi:hypothetical protein [Candidatus Phytoplasma solani]|uniref:hypothetical protein n=1 Tax=Candidatus Phytoplasma solani TaxID=69896 RepID=UPI00358E54D3